MQIDPLDGLDGYEAGRLCELARPCRYAFHAAGAKDIAMRAVSARMPNQKLPAFGSLPALRASSCFMMTSITASAVV